jgi:nucleoside-diphosphate-sugar epimerase/uncharacterized membrane protein
MAEGSDVILTTGGSGLIGVPVIRRLAASARVIGFDREGNPNPPKEAECVCVDVTSDQSVRDGLSRVRYADGDHIASVIHLAAYYDFSGEPSPKYEEVTVRGTERLLRGLQDFRVEQFVFSSTMLVHAPSQPGQRITEDSPLDPKWDYPKSKVKTEELIRAQRGAIPVVLLRIAGVYDDDCHSIPIAHQIQRIYERQLTSRFFPGDTARGRQSFVHLDDLVDAIARVVERRARLPNDVTVLIGEPEALSYDELQEEIGCLVHGEAWKTREVPPALAKAGAWLRDTLPVGEEPFIKPWMIEFADDNYELDITRARTTLGWEPQRSLRATLPKMIDALKADPLGWYRKNKLEPPASVAGSAAKETQVRPSGEQPRTEGRGAQPDKAAPYAHAQHKAGEAAEKSGEQRAAAPRSMDAMGDMEKEPGAMMAKHHAMSLWVHPILMALGAWLIASPFTLGYRSMALVWSDVGSGALVIVLAALSLSKERAWASWANSFVGAWLLFAPLAFWAPTAGAYVNDTLVGALVIAFSVLIPHGMPMAGPDVPRGWTYNPSSWLQRSVVIALGLLGFLGARYMAAYQLGHIQTAWDPFFGNSTMRVLTSEVSRAWPVSDAGLGAMTYLLEVLMGLMGDKRRWRTMPWMVTFFGILVVPLGVTSIVLVILQPLSVGAWCSLCLATAVAMLVMIPLTLDEVVAMGQFLVQRHRAGKLFWRTFWLGGELPGAAEETKPRDFGSPPNEMLPAMVWGVTMPWTLVASAALGVWVMFAPAVFQSQAASADSDRLVGALVVTFAVIAWAEVGRAIRFINVLFGAWLVASPWLLGGSTTGSTWSDVVVGVALTALSIPRGTVRQRYGDWDRYIR